MRRSLFLLFCYLIPLLCKAQFQHYASINGNVYGNFFNKEKEPFGPIPFTKPQVILPELSYKIEKGKHGLEIYFNNFYRKYQDLEYGKTNAGDFLEIARFFIGINYHRRIYQTRFFSISPFAGLTHGSYIATTLALWTSNPKWHEAILGGGERVNTLGLQLGGNINIPIWKGLYFNGNLRYGAVPWARYDYFRHNMVINLGVGYKF